MIDDMVYLKYCGQIVAGTIISVKRTLFGNRYIIEVPYKNGSRDFVKRLAWRVWL